MDWLDLLKQFTSDEMIKQAGAKNDLMKAKKDKEESDKRIAESVANLNSQRDQGLKDQEEFENWLKEQDKFEKTKAMLGK